MVLVSLAANKIGVAVEGHIPALKCQVVTVVPENAGLKEEMGKGVCRQMFTAILRCKQKGSKAELTAGHRQIGQQIVTF